MTINMLGGTELIILGRKQNLKHKIKIIMPIISTIVFMAMTKY